MTPKTLVDKLLRLAPHTEVVHHVPGRIRIRLLPSGLSLVKKMDMKEVLNGIPGICDVRVNPFAASVVVEYDRARLAAGLWEMLDEVRRKPESATEIGGKLEHLFNA